MTSRPSPDTPCARCGHEAKHHGSGYSTGCTEPAERGYTCPCTEYVAPRNYDPRRASATGRGDALYTEARKNALTVEEANDVLTHYFSDNDREITADALAKLRRIAGGAE